jgi:hypothetical protein
LNGPAPAAKFLGGKVRKIAAFEYDFTAVRPFGNTTTAVPVSERGYRRRVLRRRRVFVPMPVEN